MDSLKQMTRPKMSIVESSGIGQGQPLHAPGKIGLILSKTSGGPGRHEKYRFVHFPATTHDTARPHIRFAMLCPYRQIYIRSGSRATILVTMQDVTPSPLFFTYPSKPVLSSPFPFIYQFVYFVNNVPDAPIFRRFYRRTNLEVKSHPQVSGNPDLPAYSSAVDSKFLGCVHPTGRHRF